jgi:hypothetical protein
MFTHQTLSWICVIVEKYVHLQIQGSDAAASAAAAAATTTTTTIHLIPQYSSYLFC